MIAQKSDGGLRDALSIFDQVLSFTNGNITYQSVIDNLNVLDYEYYFRLTDAILAGNVRGAILLLNEILSKGFDGQNIISGMAGHFRDLLVCKDEATLVLFEVGASIRERYIEMAKRCPDPFLFRAIELANQCDLNYRASRNKRLLLELTLIQLCQLTHPATPTDGEDKKKTLIEPINTGTPTAQPTKTVPQPESKVVTTQMPVNVQPVMPTVPTGTTAVKNTSSRPVSTSFKDLDKKPKEEVIQQPESIVDLKNVFSQEDLVEHWNAFAETIDTKVYLKNTMINSKPVMLENFLFEVAIHNQGQQDELSNSAVSILSYLRHHLKNTHIQMRIRISESNEKKLAYTNTEKYQHLMEINPLLGKLRDEFNLTLD